MSRNSETCSKGHRMTKENTYVSPDHRTRCRECLRIIRRNWAARNPDRVMESVKKYKKKVRSQREKIGG